MRKTRMRISSNDNLNNNCSAMRRHNKKDPATYSLYKLPLDIQTTSNIRCPNKSSIAI